MSYIILYIYRILSQFPWTHAAWFPQMRPRAVSCSVSRTANTSSPGDRRPRMSLLLVMLYDVNISSLSCHPCVWWNDLAVGWGVRYHCVLKLLHCKWHNLRRQVSFFGLANHHQRRRNGSATLMMQKGSLKCSDRLTSAVADLYALFCTGQLHTKPT